MRYKPCLVLTPALVPRPTPGPRFTHAHFHAGWNPVCPLEGIRPTRSMSVLAHCRGWLGAALAVNDHGSGRGTISRVVLLAVFFVFFTSAARVMSCST